MKRAYILTLLIFCNTSIKAGLPVYDGPRHATDLLDNIQDIIDQVTQISNQAEQIENQIEQIEKLTEQIQQMDDYLERVGHAAKVAVKTEKLLTGDIKDILKEIDEYIFGEGLTDKDKKENIKLYGDIEKQEHIRTEEPEPEQKYTKHELVEKEFAAYKKTSESISLKRLGILEHLEELGKLLNSAATDQEVQKLNSSINAHNLMLVALKDEEERQFRSFSAELKRNHNALEKEITRYEERAKMLDISNRTRPVQFKLSKSAEILNLIEGDK